MLTPAWTQLRYHEEQAKMWRSSARFIIAACGRGSGKTELARRRIVRYLAVRKPWYDPIYFYALPTYKQAKRVAWEQLLALIPKEWLSGRPNISEMVIKTVFGSRLYVVGMDKPQRIEGVQWDGCVIDEAADQKPGTFDRSVLPALAHRNAWCWRIGVPKRYGIGALEFKRAFEEPGAETETFNWPSADILSSNEIALAMSKLGIADFREQYEATFENISGAIFYAFDEDLNTTDSIGYDKSLPIVVGSDFNVDPMSWVIGHRIDGNKLHIFDEVSLRHTNTRRTLDELYRRYGKHLNGFEFYGDASGAARRSSADLSDYLQIRNDSRFSGARVFYPKANPRIASRFAATNGLLCNTKGERNCYIHPKCTHLIQDLKSRAYKEGTSIPDDYGDVGHMTDALGYIIHKVFPIRLRSVEDTRVYSCRI